MSEPPTISEDEPELPGLIDWGDALLDATLRAEQDRVVGRRRRRRVLSVLAAIGVLAVPGAVVATRAWADPGAALPASRVEPGPPPRMGPCPPTSACPACTCRWSRRSTATTAST